MSEVKPLQLSDDWDNNLYRNLVHVIATNENMIPGGVAEKLIPVIKAIYKPLLQQARLSTAGEIFEAIEKHYTENRMAIFMGDTDWQSLKSRFEEEK